MAVFYQGPRPVTKGRNANDSIHPIKGVGTYSNWSLFNTSHVLDGAPNENHVPGEGRHPGDVFMSRRYLGLDTLAPMDGSGGGARLEGGRYRPLEYKGLTASRAFATDFGHDYARETVYGYDHFSVDNKFDVMADMGHGVRSIDAAGTANTFGRFGPLINQGISDEPLEDSGQAVPEGATAYANAYGHNRVNEWRGVPSSRAL